MDRKCIRHRFFRLKRRFLRWRSDFRDGYPNPLRRSRDPIISHYRLTYPALIACCLFVIVFTASPLSFRPSLSNHLSHRSLVLSFFFAFYFFVFNFISPFCNYSSICFHDSVTPFVHLIIPYLNSIPLTPPFSPTIPYHSFIFPCHFFLIIPLSQHLQLHSPLHFLSLPIVFSPLSTRFSIMHVRKW